MVCFFYYSHVWDFVEAMGSWGDLAVEFDADAVRAMGETEPVIAIFLRILPKTVRGK